MMIMENDLFDRSNTFMKKAFVWKAQGGNYTHVE
jgi:hypothetical protein